MKKFNLHVLHSLLAHANVLNAKISTALPLVPCFTSDASRGEQAHTSSNAWQWETANGRGWITRGGLVTEFDTLKGQQRVLPFGGCADSEAHKLFMASQFPLENYRGIR